MKLDPKTTALLTLDFQKGIFGFVPGAEVIVPNASKAVEFARKKQYQIIHVGLGFSEGHPEIPDTDADFDDPDDEPITIKGEPLSETVIRERR